ncbi:MAG TPA: bifunctional hexulose-6-phosphate synthase/ribonuclease regulator, partial [bacterium]|nr:bifunctional hexulose-6-phosphate synthase/ribonuclease regulator [bacterium]
SGPAVWGELATHSARIKGIAGVVIWGGIRDVGEIRKLEFPSWAKIITPQAGEPRGLGEMSVPLQLGGVLVKPGDWIAGDADGLMLIPKEQAAETANRAMDVLEKENRIRSEIMKKRKSLAEVTELLKWEKK